MLVLETSSIASEMLEVPKQFYLILNTKRNYSNKKSRGDLYLAAPKDLNLRQELVASIAVKNLRFVIMKIKI